MPTTDLPEIAPVELMMVEVGIDAIISREVERIGKGRLSAMAQLPGKIKTLARQLVHDEITPHITASDFEWRRDFKDIVAGWDVQQVIDMCAMFPQEYQATAQALIARSKLVIDELTQGLPISKYQTLAGMTDVAPSDAHVFKFVSVLEVTRNPLIVFDLMACGGLLKLQANAVRQVYPTLSSAIDAAILNATMQAKSARKSFEIPTRIETGIKAWGGQGPLSPDKLKAAQTSVQAANAKKAEAQAKKPNISKSPETMLTQAQKADSVSQPERA